MPHLHLPIDHTDADLVLAVNLAEIVGSEDLYVAWTHESGPGAIPEIEAVMTQQGTTVGFFAAVGAGFVAFWRALLGKPAQAAVEEDAPPPPVARPYAD